MELFHPAGSNLSSTTAVDFVSDEISACQSCRRRKLKCSRELPHCSHCQRLGESCLYDRERQRPGFKGGVINGLNRRLELLERILLDEDGSPKTRFIDEENSGFLHPELPPTTNSPQFSTHSTTAQLAPHHAPEPSNSSRAKTRDRDEELNISFGFNRSLQPGNARKRQRLDGEEEVPSIVLDNPLPPDTLVRIAVKTFCDIQHPWIPFLHLSRFRDHYLHNGVTSPESRVILYAIVVAAINHISEDESCMNRLSMEAYAMNSQQVVMLTAMDSLSIENIQALIIIAFHYIGSGNIFKAWPIVGSLTRTVQYLQLTAEPDDTSLPSLFPPLLLLERPIDWTESEDRRRIFWNVFQLDRFCSVTTGWNPSLTSADVHCRLPCDGGLWRRQEAVTTPYFGIWDNRAAKIGKSLAAIPTMYNEDSDVERSGNSSQSKLTFADISKLGAFAYCIEATESLSQITEFFLRQSIDVQNQQGVNSWLTRFKELDLRLVHWKMFLPQKWQDSNISEDKASISMDPNLTLAHITHNTSTILLHQHIAFPPNNLKMLVRLPSVCSAETCQLAARETASISAKYLKHTTHGITNHQFAFCAFVAARILLVCWRVQFSELDPAFASLVNSLQLMSLHWNGYRDFTRGEARPAQQHNLAGQYAQYLIDLQQECTDSSSFEIDADLGCLLPPSAIPDRFRGSQSTRLPSWVRSRRKRSTDDGKVTDRREYGRQAAATTPQARSQRSNSSWSPVAIDDTNIQSHSRLNNIVGIEEAMSGQNQPFQQHQPQTSHTARQSMVPPTGQPANQILSLTDIQRTPGAIDNDLMATSYELLGQEFLGMDRVITLDGANFDLHWNGWDDSAYHFQRE
ncbi:hypothetical protein BP6252_11642 [Coleophoma cylindrospora]|uniref:Zn(2)-C6 fungal-type domain-containing protein n=1 Tax=Coleophoma cylindrospora TaxID=1849047 RepID=A0A3D8QKA0_9HELO|nr:hypothetical protein BP6252_11642 [Coleophoma cylindrospora]